MSVEECVGGWEHNGLAHRAWSGLQRDTVAVRPQEFGGNGAAQPARRQAAVRESHRVPHSLACAVVPDLQRLKLGQVAWREDFIDCD